MCISTRYMPAVYYMLDITAVTRESMPTSCTSLTAGSSTITRWAPEPMLPTTGCSVSVCSSLEKLDIKTLAGRGHGERLEMPQHVHNSAPNKASCAKYSFPTLSPAFLTSLETAAALPCVWSYVLCIFLSYIALNVQLSKQ